jgi:hypothetical protein
MISFSADCISLTYQVDIQINQVSCNRKKNETFMTSPLSIIIEYWMQRKLGILIWIAITQNQSQLSHKWNSVPLSRDFCIQLSRVVTV